MHDSMQRQTLFESRGLQLHHISVVRPTTRAPGAIEHADANVLAFTLTGLFARHESSRRHVVATPNHALLLPRGRPYRLSFPGQIGDTCLTLRWSPEALSRVLPQAMSREAFDDTEFSTHVLIPPSVMMQRSLLWQRLRQGQTDPLAVEEQAVSLLASTLHLAQRLIPSDSRRQTRRIERVKEAIASEPRRRWNLTELAELACLSVGHLAHVFRRQVGVSVYDYVLRERLAHALHAVLESDDDLTSVALDAGFTSHSHFTARFRVRFGITPFALRRARGSRGRAEMRRIVTATLAPAT
jgi:AraC-like DNA-binding protein